MTLGRKIRTAREKKHLTCRDLADLVQSSEEFIQCCEEESYTPDVPMQAALAEALDISLFYLRNEECRNPRALYFLQEAMILLYDKGGDRALEKYEEEIRPFSSNM